MSACVILPRSHEQAPAEEIQGCIFVLTDSQMHIQHEYTNLLFGFEYHCRLGHLHVHDKALGFIATAYNELISTTQCEIRYRNTQVHLTP